MIGEPFYQERLIIALTLTKDGSHQERRCDPKHDYDTKQTYPKCMPGCQLDVLHASRLDPARNEVGQGDFTTSKRRQDLLYTLELARDLSISLLCAMERARSLAI